MEINEETLDYIQTKLSAVVQSNVEGRLFKLYRAYLYTALAILTFVGIPSLAIYASSRIDSQIEAQITKKTEEPIKRANDAANNAAVEAEKIKARAEEKFKSIEKTLNDLDDRRHALDSQLNEARTSVKDINSSLAENKSSIEDLKKSIEASRNYLGEKYASIGAFNDLISQTQTLGLQVSLLDKALRELADKVKAPESVSAAGGVEAASQKIQQKLTAQLPAQKAIMKPTVFVQFAGGSRDQINDLIRAVGAGDKYTLPGAERLSSAAGKHSIRYYYDQDRESALGLQKDTNEALINLGYKGIQVDDPTIPQGVKKPRPGVLELWLELPPRSQ